MIYLEHHHSSTARSFASDAYIGVTRFRGMNLRPSALKNFELNSTHCRRRACRKHSIESIPIMTPAVIDTKKYIPIKIIIALALTIPPPIVFSKNTRASWPWAKDKAHKRRYDAVFEILPKTNSIVSIIWCTAISLMSCYSPWPPCSPWTTLWLSFLSSSSSSSILRGV